MISTIFFAGCEGANIFLDFKKKKDILYLNLCIRMHLHE